MANGDLKPKDAKLDSSRDPGLDPATGEYRVIAPGQTFRSVTEKISRIVLTPDTPLGWFALFGGSALATRGR